MRLPFARALFSGGESRCVAALLGVGALVVAIVYLFHAGVGIWGIDWPVVWGFAIINYVWWIAIASGGTFISALFYLAGVEWRASLNRLAETMTLFAAACAGIYPVLHLGRPWLFYWLFPFPEQHDVVAAIPQSVALGLFRHPGLCAVIDPVLVFWPDSRSRDHARRGEDARRAKVLRRAGDWAFAAREINGGIIRRPMACWPRS